MWNQLCQALVLGFYGLFTHWLSVSCSKMINPFLMNRPHWWWCATAKGQPVSTRSWKIVIWLRVDIPSPWKQQPFYIKLMGNFPISLWTFSLPLPSWKIYRRWWNNNIEKWWLRLIIQFQPVCVGELWNNENPASREKVLHSFRLYISTRSDNVNSNDRAPRLVVLFTVSAVASSHSTIMGNEKEEKKWLSATRAAEQRECCFCDRLCLDSHH